MKRLASIAVVLALLVAAPAQAGQRYATPTGGGEACSKETPCQLREAVTKATAGDEVIVGVGTYPITENLTVLEGIDVHGDFGAARPVITSETGGKLVSLRRGAGLRYFEIVDTAATDPDAISASGLIERVRVIASGTRAVAVALGGGAIVRDSVFRATGSEAAGVRGQGIGPGQTELLRNVTAIASGEKSTGVRALYQDISTAGSVSVDLENVIARGEESDLRANGNEQGTASISATSSNFATAKIESEGAIVPGAGNQTSTPLFVNAAAGDYRELAESPTIDAGTAGDLGALDFDGNPRVIGPAPDIGAYEFVPTPTGGVRSISIKPKRFKARPSGGPVAGGILKSRPPVGAKVTYTMSGPATVDFGVSKRVAGRSVGKVCKHAARVATSRVKRCFFYVPVKGSFTQDGATGSNSFVFSGRIGGRTLKPGAYKLTAFAGHLVSAAFEIGGLRHHRHRG